MADGLEVLGEHERPEHGGVEERLNDGVHVAGIAQVVQTDFVPVLLSDLQEIGSNYLLIKLTQRNKISHRCLKFLVLRSLDILVGSLHLTLQLH